MYHYISELFFPLQISRVILRSTCISHQSYARYMFGPSHLIDPITLETGCLLQGTNHEASHYTTCYPLVTFPLLGTNIPLSTQTGTKFQILNRKKSCHSVQKAYDLSFYGLRYLELATTCVVRDLQLCTLNYVYIVQRSSCCYECSPSE
jgi:hypothetical protein